MSCCSVSAGGWSVARSGQSDSSRAEGRMWITFQRKSDLPRGAKWSASNNFCNGSIADISRTQIHFLQPWSGLDDFCGPIHISRAEMRQENLVFDRILTGRPEWSIDIGRLTISNPKRGSVVFRSEPMH